jgi:ribosomal subunit interface protein
LRTSTEGGDVQIRWTHLDALDSAERRDIEERLERLAAGHDDLIDVRIVARRTRHHRHGDREVRIVCRARGKEIVAARTRENVGLALNEALDTFEREVHRLRERRRTRRSERPALPPHLGVIARVLVKEGYGFVLTDAGEEVYFHRNAVNGPLDFERLEEGQRVGLNIEAGREGLQATAIVPAPPDAPSP